MTDVNLILAIAGLIVLLFLIFPSAKEEVKLRDLERKVEAMERRIEDLEKIRPEIQYTVLDNLEITELREKWLKYHIELQPGFFIPFSKWFREHYLKGGGHE